MSKFGRIYYFKDLMKESLVLEEMYAPLLTRTVIGKSVDQRDIVMLKVGIGKNALICTGGLHGRESINPMVLMRIAGEYCRQYFHTGRDYDGIRDFLTECSIYFIPLLNPDGYMIALRGFCSIHNMEYKYVNPAKGIPNTEWKFNGRGVDLNRNFPSVTWRQSSEEDYPASEPETRALIDLFERIPSCGYIDYHSRGDMIYYHRRVMCGDYNKRQLKLASSLACITGYRLVPPEEELDTAGAGGNSVHYYSEFIGNPAITIETVDEEEGFPLSVGLQCSVYGRIKNTPKRFLRDIICFGNP